MLMFGVHALSVGFGKLLASCCLCFGNLPPSHPVFQSEWPDSLREVLRESLDPFSIL